MSDLLTRLEPYADVVDLRAYIPDMSDVLKDSDMNLQRMLKRATSIIHSALVVAVADPFFYLGTQPQPVERPVYGLYRADLPLPPCVAGTVSSIVDQAGTTVDPSDYTVAEETPGRSVVRYAGLPWADSTSVWSGRYIVTAAWSYGEPSAAIQELCIELAVNIRQSSERGMFSDQAGIDAGGSVRIGQRLDSLHRSIIEREAERWRKAARYE